MRRKERTLCGKGAGRSAFLRIKHELLGSCAGVMDPNSYRYHYITPELAPARVPRSDEELVTMLEVRGGRAFVSTRVAKPNMSPLPTRQAARESEPTKHRP